MIYLIILAVLGVAGYLYFLKHRAIVLTEIAVIKADAIEIRNNLKARIEALEDKLPKA